MQKFTTITGIAAHLPMINVDTDMIIPKQYLKTIKRTGLGQGLFAEKRYRDDGSENPDFVLNKPAYRKARILVADDNFGCGSSREHAPWALMDFGIRCVISTSFGDIFYNNCFKNGILPIRVSQDELDKLFDDAERHVIRHEVARIEDLLGHLAEWRLGLDRIAEEIAGGNVHQAQLPGDPGGLRAFSNPLRPHENDVHTLCPTPPPHPGGCQLHGSAPAR